MDTATINAAFNLHGCDKGTQHPRAHHYGPVYARVFRGMTGVSSLMEVGVQRGRSIAAWRVLFPQARIVGIDSVDVTTVDDGYVGLYPQCPPIGNWEFVQGDSTDPETSTRVNGNFDIIIDDGSHVWEDQLKTFTNFKDRFDQVYVIEDIVGPRHERFLRNEIKKLGFTNLFTYDSRLQIEAEYGTRKENVIVKMLVIVKDADRQLER